jgi:hypothetical protein
MRWVKFSERFPSADDKSSVSIESNEVFVRGFYGDGTTYASIVIVDDCHEWGVDMTSEWLEGAFEVELKP